MPVQGCEGTKQKHHQQQQLGLNWSFELDSVQTRGPCYEAGLTCLLYMALLSLANTVTWSLVIGWVFFVCLFVLIKPSYEHFRITCVMVAPDDQLQRLWDYSHLKSEQTVILI